MTRRKYYGAGSTSFIQVICNGKTYKVEQVKTTIADDAALLDVHHRLELFLLGASGRSKN